MEDSGKQKEMGEEVDKGKEQRHMARGRERKGRNGGQCKVKGNGRERT